MVIVLFQSFTDSFEVFRKLPLSHQAPRIKTIPYAEELAEHMLQVNGTFFLLKVYFILRVLQGDFHRFLLFINHEKLRRVKII